MNTTTTPPAPGHAAPPPARPEHDGNGNGRDNHGQPGHGAGGEHDVHGHGDKAAVHDLPTDLPRPSTFALVMVGIVAVLLLAALFIIGFIPHHREQAQIDSDAQAITTATPIVQLAKLTPSAPETDVYLPASVQAWATTAIYPRAYGYLASWTHDIGSHLKQGDVLAKISAPDVDAQLLQAKATLEQGVAAVAKAKADLVIAQNTYQRYQQWMNTTAGVSQQDLEDRKNAYEDAIAVEKQSEANVDALKANVQLLKVQQGFETIQAPFTGVVTARNYDVGALLNPSNASAKDMFDMQETDHLRVFISVPQTYASTIVTGTTKAFLTVRNYPGKEFPGTVARSAGAVDPTTRTMIVEVDVENKDGSLSPGMYGTVRLPVTQPHPSLVVPTSALVFDAAGLRLALVQDNDTVHYVNVTAGRDYGTQIEITKGITAQDKVIDDPGMQIAEGSKVQIQSSGKPQPGQSSNQKMAQAN